MEIQGIVVLVSAMPLCYLSGKFKASKEGEK
jgi:hypothetical protein